MIQAIVEYQTEDPLRTLILKCAENVGYQYIDPDRLDMACDKLEREVTLEELKRDREWDTPKTWEQFERENDGAERTRQYNG